MHVHWGKEKKFSFGPELARDLKPRIKVSEALQPHEGDIGTPFHMGAGIGNGSEPTDGLQLT